MGETSVTFYALFDEVVRIYNIRFYNGTTMLQTLRVAYGTMPVYTGTEPTTEGMDFGGWTPALAPVTGDADYVAKFVAPSITRALLKRTITEYSSDAVTSIGEYAFASCKALTSVSLPMATKLNDSAFYYCSALTSVSLPMATEIGYAAFQYCSFTSISLPMVTILKGQAFNYCPALTSVSLPSVTRLDTFALTNNTPNLKAIRLPATPPSLDTNAIYNINSECVFYIPTGATAAYQANGYWKNIMPNYSFVEEDR
jgi:hypothetical protein